MDDCIVCSFGYAQLSGIDCVAYFVRKLGVATTKCQETK